MKPENRFITSVHNRVPDSVYREKMHNPYRGGTFDVWYSGSKTDLWIEYKYIERIQKKGLVVPALSALQLDWGTNRFWEGRNVYVILGCPEGGVVYSPHQWEEGVSVEEFRKALLTKPKLAAWIYKQATGKELDDGNTKTVKPRVQHGVRVQDSNSRVSTLRTSEIPKETPK